MIHRETYKKHLKMADEISRRKDFSRLVKKYRSVIGTDHELRDDYIKACVFIALREQGVEEVWALMHACRRATGARGTDRAFNAGQRRRMENMDPVNRDLILKKAKRAGISTQGKYYCGGLGHYTDPCAWVSTDSDVLEVANKRNLELSGPIERRAVDVFDEPKSVVLAEDIIQDRMRRAIASDPKVAEQFKKNPKRTSDSLREQVIAKHAYPKRT